MLTLVLLFLTLSGLQALPIAAPKQPLHPPVHQLPEDCLRGVGHPDTRGPIPGGFRQGTEPSRKFLVDLNTGLVKEHVSEMDRRVVADVPAKKHGKGWVREEEPSNPQLPVRFRQGTEPKQVIPVRFRQGTEPEEVIPVDFRQGTEPEHVIPVSFRQGTEPKLGIPVDFRQGTEPKPVIPVDFRQGTEPKPVMPVGFRQGTEPKPVMPVGFRQGTEPKPVMPVGFRQGTEPKLGIPVDFRQGTEPKPVMPVGFRQGTEPKLGIPVDFRQGTEPKPAIPVGFRQGTEPKMEIAVGFRQGTEPKMEIAVGFRQGTEPKMEIPVGFRQGTEPSTAKDPELMAACKGKVINVKCYQFNPTPLAFKDAQAFCRNSVPKAELTSVTNSGLHTGLVSLVTNDSLRNPVLTWLGATVKNQQASWVDGSDWSYSDWMPGHPNIHTDKPVCVEMFKKGESWWTAADCELKRASICSYSVLYPVSA